MKRILSLIICGLLIFSACASYAQAAVKLESNYDLAVAEGLLEALGIMDITDNADEYVSRADFACYVARAIGVDEYVKPVEMYFRDIPVTHWAANCVNTLAEMGAISYDGVTTFRPDDTITLNEAVKILTEVLGYGVMADAKGGYPAGYIRAANMIDLLSGVDAQESLTVADAALLIRNALDANLYFTVSFGGESNEYKQSETDTLLSEYHDIYYTEGMLDATELTSLTSENGVGENRIAVDGVSYICEGNFFDYLGSYVEVYYRKSADDTIGEIVLVAPANNKNEIIEITNEDFVSFGNDYVLRFYSEQAQKVKSVSISKSAAFIYNGVYVNEDIVEYMNIEHGEIKVISDKKGAYSTVVITEYKTIPVGYVDAEKGYVYAAGDLKNKLDLSGENEKIFIFDENDNEVGVSSIAKNNILTVYENPGKLVHVYLSRTNVSGVIERVVRNDDKVEITIDGDMYEADIDFYEKEKNMLKINANVTLYLDIRGKIAYVTFGGENNYEYGYLTNATFENSMCPELMIKIFTTEGAFGVFKTDESLTIDETKYKDLNQAKDALMQPGTTEIKPQLVRFIADDRGVIKRIDTEKRGPNETEDSLTQTAYTPNGNGFDYISVGILGKKIAFDKSTLLFKVPKDADAVNATDDMLTVTDLTKKITWTGTELVAYTANSESGVSEVVVQKLDWSSTEPEKQYNLMIDEIQQALDDDGNEVERIVGWRDGAQIEYDVDSDVSFSNSGVEKGDLVILAVNAGNIVKNFKLVYDASANEIFDNNASNAYADNIFSCNGANYFAAQSMRFGYADSVKGTVISMSYDKGGEVEEVYPVSNQIPTVFDTSVGKGVIYKGSLGDIADYANAGDDCSKIIVYAEYGVWKSYYIYK